MKYKTIFSILAIFLFLNILSLVSGELYLWQTVNIDTSNSIVNSHSYYQFEDTSERGIGKNKEIEVLLAYDVEGLPYNLSAYNYSGEIDWCNFSIRHYVNEYDEEGNYLNTTMEIESYYFQNTINSSSGQVTKNLVDRDSLIIDMKCHYTNSSTLYIENVLFGRYTTYFPAFECEGCEEYSLEELSDEIERVDETISQQTVIYRYIQKVIGMNYKLWLIASLFIKLAFLLIAVILIFAGVYYLYLFFKDIERQI